MLRRLKIRALDHVGNHAVQTQILTIMGRINALYTVGLQNFYFLSNNHTTAAAKHFYVAGAALAQHINHVLEILDMPALVRAHRNAMNIFLDGRRNHILDRPVVTQMNDLGALGLEDAAHDVDCSIMAIKQGGRGDKAHLALGVTFNTGTQRWLA